MLHSFVCLFSQIDPVKRNGIGRLADEKHVWLREGDVRYPIGGVRHSMVDARLAVLGARIAGRDDADQFPASVLLQHQRTAGISLQFFESNWFIPFSPSNFDSVIYLTGIFAAIPISGAHHFVVDDDVDAFGGVPVLALSVVDDGHIYHLQGLGSNARTWCQPILKNKT
jgi:hypothetical protein